MGICQRIEQMEQIERTRNPNRKGAKNAKVSVVFLCVLCAFAVKYRPATRDGETTPLCLRGLTTIFCGARH